MILNLNLKFIGTVKLKNGLLMINKLLMIYKNIKTKNKILFNKHKINYI